MQGKAMQCNAMQGNVLQCDATQCDATQCNAMQREITPGHLGVVFLSYRSLSATVSVPARNYQIYLADKGARHKEVVEWGGGGRGGPPSLLSAYAGCMVRVRGSSNGLTNHPGGDVCRGLLMYAGLLLLFVVECYCFLINIIVDTPQP